MPQRETVFDKARALEKKYGWLKAAKLYEQTLLAVGIDNLVKRAEFQEKIGQCFHRASFQAESREEFKQRMQRAVEAYEKANEFYEKLGEEQKARSFRSRAVAKYLGYWLTSDSSEKRRLLDECLELAGKALETFSESRDMQEYGRTFNALSFEFSVFSLRWMHEWDRKVIEEAVKKGVRWGEKAGEALSELGDPYEAAKAYLVVATCLLTLTWFAVADPEVQEQDREKALRYINKALDLSEKTGDAYFSGLSHFWLGFNMEGEESVRCFEKALDCSEKTRDIYQNAFALDFLAYAIYWKAIETEDPDQRLKLAEEAMQHYDKAQHLFSIVSLISPRGGLISPPGGYTEHYRYLAEWETDPEKKLGFLRKSEKNGIEALKVAESSEVPSAIAFMLHILSKTLTARARLEPDFDEKKSLLEKALRYIDRSIGMYVKWKPFAYWNMAVMYNELADIKAETGYLESDPKTKRTLLEEAASNKEKCLALMAKRIPYFEKRGMMVPFASLYGYQDTYWILLKHLYKLTKNPEHLRKAIEVSQKAMETAIRLNMATLMAESHWKIAEAQDVLQEHLAAAENFERASESYSKAAEKISQLKDLYQDYALYMQAWSEIEKAKHYHAEKKYGQAKESYEKAANLHKSTERWNYLSPNYSALALIEAAEDMSRKEQTEEARNLFQQAANLLGKAKQSLKIRLEKIELRDEKEMATELIRTSDTRQDYCIGRIALEEAKTLDRQGDHATSSERYAKAAETFTKLARAESEKIRKELQPIIHLCQAWQKMMIAEAKASSTMYGEAAELFKQAKESTLDQSTSLLALANSSFCKALEAGTEFETTRDMTLYSTAKKHMEIAADYYLKAGYVSASEYAKATNRLLDAYLYMNKAHTEMEPSKKAQYYRMAEEVLQASAGAYAKAKHPEKSEEVQRLLESVKEERQLALTLSEVLHAPTIVSTTSSFSTPAPTHERAVGLERFEHAEVQANLITRVREVMVGDDVNLEIELVNAGKAPAMLIKVQEVVPEAFEVKEVSETCRVEDRYLNMKGRRLDPLKTEEVKMIVKPLSKGTFTIQPRILYLDETGKYKSYDPEPIPMTVKELGIRGWLKGKG